MSPLVTRRLWADVAPRRGSRYERARVILDGGGRTTVHIASYATVAFQARVVQLTPPMQLVRWCRGQGARNAVVGGFFVRPQYAPLGQLQIAGEVRDSVPFEAPWGDMRACVQITDGWIRIAPRDVLGEDPRGDLLQAGPLLIADGRSVFAEGDDVEGFSAGASQFDSDITNGRYPRTALGIAGDRLIAVACDGRTRRDAGMTLSELRDTLLDLGVSDALNLDGGGSSSLVHAGRLRNRPREEHGVDLLDGRAVVTAIVFESR